MKTFCTFHVYICQNICFKLLICIIIAKNLIWPSFRFFENLQILGFHIIVFYSNIVLINHTSMQRFFIQILGDVIISIFKHDWFCGPWSQFTCSLSTILKHNLKKTNMLAKLKKIFMHYQTLKIIKHAMSTFISSSKTSSTSIM